ncbi:MAG: YdeI/OmpD-associated family protein [Owenweeksia sp.]
MPAQQNSFKTFIRPPAGQGIAYYPVLDVPPEIAEGLLGKKQKERIVLHFSNGKKVHRALQRSKNGETFILLGKSVLKEAGKAPGDEVTVSIEKDTSKYGMPMPEEFEEVLNQDEEGRQLFEKLKPGMKRSFLYFINSAKTVDTRINRSFQLVEKLKNGEVSGSRRK